MYYGGVEGGGTKTSISIYNSEGKEIKRVLDGPSTNFFLLGKEEAVSRLVAVIKECYAKAGLPEDTTLESLGLCLSGGENEKTNNVIKEMIKSHGVAKSVIVKSDTIGPLATIGNEGVVLIAGTGSNCLTASGARCGGWGSFIGDEGGAHWIAQLATRWIFHSEDNFRHKIEPFSKEELRPLKEVIMNYFKIDELSDILTYCYDTYSKSHYAGVTKRIAELAQDTSDPVTKKLFSEAGSSLAYHVLAVEDHVEKNLNILCIGSLWLSWDLLKEGFVGTFSRHSRNIKSIKLLRLVEPSTLGAAYLGALEIGIKLPIDFKKNYDVFFETEL
ncbi:N-acetyl-D-glucosamine kinase [Lepeophtheirus salmonis]|uniref:N-acetyl-D-glucosamine kinase n=1 Tax=Lepeophtheirus salmonis TaxID=72036 RepID=UPI001AE482BA|nr:N-acetyl-D-glucosamine kinase-like [Lepeophtheirus salmonis]